VHSNNVAQELRLFLSSSGLELDGMPDQQLALWELMAAALHKALPIIEVMADYESTPSCGDSYYRE
jgi:hypothetical protein